MPCETVLQPPAPTGAGVLSRIFHKASIGIQPADLSGAGSAKPTNPRRNSFTALRLGLALLVVFGHSFVAGGFGPEPMERLTGGKVSGRELAVVGFFILSSYLLCLSLDRNRSLARFALRRAFRILPGYWVCLCVTTFLLVPLSFAFFYPGQLSYWESLAFTRHSALHYLGVNAWLVERQSFIAGMFEHNPLPSTINASLWTVRLEVRCYIGLALFAAFNLQKRRAVTIGLFTLLYLRQIAAALPAGFRLPHPLAFMAAAPYEILLVAFAAGALLHSIFRDRKLWNAAWFAIATAGVIASLFCPAPQLIWPLALPYMLVCLGERLPFRGLEARGDISYGIYLYSFVLQQCLVALDLHRHGFVLFLTLSVALSAAAGCASWLFVERPAIAFGAWIVSRLPKRAAAGRAPMPSRIGAADMEASQIRGSLRN